jgi:hypothetical protein
VNVNWAAVRWCAMANGRGKGLTFARGDEVDWARHNSHFILLNRTLLPSASRVAM